ncbi:general secretion pathway protein GspK [Rhodoferax lacus]|uniref:Type II secretion system protein K n=1 Tax=Rhodoferax lacus TaxID=2184758 RepID=A0A3E1RE20_9BURK|nr:type II secretion system minor pseudopilin GspK [Rhodoferax lacus]RFO97618.1 general secretion pathway protein GspK [Rhodoferax lacus]
MKPITASATGTRRQRGAALLTAMLTVTLVATFASAALWQQWRSVEIEAAERSRTQMQWVLNGALDWARLILQEDGRNGEIDHLSEPWALPLQEARLSSFLAVDKNNTDDAMDAFLSGQISDQQALLNVRNLVVDGKANLPAFQAFGRLFTLLNLPRNQLQVLVDQLIASDAASADATANSKSASLAQAPLKPYRMEQLVWLGLPAATIKALMPYATLLPVVTPVNLNTAGAEVLSAALPNTDLAQAQQMVTQRATAHFKTLAEALKAAGIPDATAAQVDTKDYAIGTHFFAVLGRLRLGDSAVQEVSLVERMGSDVKVRWRQREALTAAATASLQ